MMQDAAVGRAPFARLSSPGMPGETMRKGRSMGRSTGRTFAAMALLLALGAGQAAAQTWPSQTVSIVVPFQAGGPVVSLGRVMAPFLQERLGQNVIVEN